MRRKKLVKRILEQVSLFLICLPMYLIFAKVYEETILLLSGVGWVVFVVCLCVVVFGYLVVLGFFGWLEKLVEVK